MVYHTAPPGHETAYHSHHTEDEAFYVLDGEFTFVGDGKKTILGPGGYIFLPRGIPHGIRCTGSAPSTMLILAMPGTGFVGMMLEMAEPAKERELPPVTVPDIGKLAMLCAKYRNRHRRSTAGVTGLEQGLVSHYQQAKKHLSHEMSRWSFIRSGEASLAERVR